MTDSTLPVCCEMVTTGGGFRARLCWCPAETGMSIVPRPSSLCCSIDAGSAGDAAYRLSGSDDVLEKRQTRRLIKNRATAKLSRYPRAILKGLLISTTWPGPLAGHAHCSCKCK